MGAYCFLLFLKKYSRVGEYDKKYTAFKRANAPSRILFYYRIVLYDQRIAVERIIVFISPKN